METFTEEHNICLNFTGILNAFLSSQMTKEMESEWFTYFHVENQNLN